MDEETKMHKFSCIFFIEGIVTDSSFSISTYFPNDQYEDLIEGTMEIINDSTIKIKLPSEHGGCWNVMHFADEPVQFDLQEQINWKRITYVGSDISYFYKEPLESKKSKSYVLKDDLICIEKIKDSWAFCIFYGEKTTKGWIKLNTLL